MWPYWFHSFISQNCFVFTYVCVARSFKHFFCKLFTKVNSKNVHVSCQHVRSFGPRKIGRIVSAIRCLLCFLVVPFLFFWYFFCSFIFDQKCGGRESSNEFVAHGHAKIERLMQHATKDDAFLFLYFLVITKQNVLLLIIKSNF